MNQKAPVYAYTGSCELQDFLKPGVGIEFSGAGLVHAVRGGVLGGGAVAGSRSTALVRHIESVQSHHQQRRVGFIWNPNLLFRTRDSVKS